VSPLPSVEQAYRTIMSAFAQATKDRTPPTEAVPLFLAGGRVLAETIAAPSDIPNFTRSTVDGYAVRAVDVAAARASSPVTLRVVGAVAMGVAAGVNLRPGEAVAVPTGGALPGGADAVVMVEDTSAPPELPGFVAVHRPVAAGANVALRGEDMKAGDVILAPGHRLLPHDVGALAGVGRSWVTVYRKPRVAIISTGDEVAPPWVATGPGQVHDMNSYSLASAVARDGGEPVLLGIVLDNRSDLERAMRDALARYDMLLVSGGSSVGEHDYVKDIVGEMEPGIVIYKVSIKPGKPVLFGLSGHKPVFGVPGNPVSALVAYDVFIRTVLLRLGGQAEFVAGEAAFSPGASAEPGSDGAAGGSPKAEVPVSAGGGLAGRPVLTARLERAVVASEDRDEFVRVTLRPGPEGIVASPLPSRSGMITTMVRGHGLIRVPARGRLEAGTLVQVWPWL